MARWKAAEELARQAQAECTLAYRAFCVDGAGIGPTDDALQAAIHLRDTADDLRLMAAAFIERGFNKEHHD
jgi:hypothetical protein